MKTSTIATRNLLTICSRLRIPTEVTNLVKNGVLCVLPQDSIETFLAYEIFLPESDINILFNGGLSTISINSLIQILKRVDDKKLKDYIHGAYFRNLYGYKMYIQNKSKKELKPRTLNHLAKILKKEVETKKVKEMNLYI